MGNDLSGEVGEICKTIQPVEVLPKAGDVRCPPHSPDHRSADR